jgi:hypothetical protein
VKPPSPSRYLKQNFRAAFEGAPQIDRGAAVYHLKHGREALKEEASLVEQIGKLELVRKLRAVRRSIRHHATELQKVLANADPLRSP